MTEATVSAQVGALEPKTKLSGKVVKTTLAGVLVDIGQELPGVIHISQLQKDQVNKPEDVVQVGQMVDVWVRRVKKDRIELTMIEPLGMEWNEIKPDSVVKGKVVGSKRTALLSILAQNAPAWCMSAKSLAAISKARLKSSKRAMKLKL
jgi:ribosomal protein S1